MKYVSTLLVEKSVKSTVKKNAALCKISLKQTLNGVNVI